MHVKALIGYGTGARSSHVVLESGALPLVFLSWGFVKLEAVVHDYPAVTDFI